MPLIRGEQPHEDLWKTLLSRNSRCKGTGVGMSLEEQKAGQYGQAAVHEQERVEDTVCEW